MAVDVQIATRAGGVPGSADLVHWAESALDDADPEPDLTLRIVGRPEGHRLNQQFRNIDRPTNVLSFPFESPPGVELPLLGDVVICAPVVSREAKQQGKPIGAHYAHLVVHGVLHLRGYDHDNEADAERMESIEVALLHRLGFPDPYQTRAFGEAAP